MTARRIMPQIPIIQRLAAKTDDCGVEALLPIHAGWQGEAIAWGDG